MSLHLWPISQPFWPRFRPCLMLPEVHCWVQVNVFLLRSKFSQLNSKVVLSAYVILKHVQKKKRQVVSCMLKSLNLTFEMFFEKEKTLNHIKTPSNASCTGKVLMRSIYVWKIGKNLSWPPTYQGFFKEMGPKINLYDRVDWMIGLWKFHMWLRNAFKKTPRQKLTTRALKKQPSWKRSCYLSNLDVGTLWDQRLHLLGHLRLTHCIAPPRNHAKPKQASFSRQGNRPMRDPFRFPVPRTLGQTKVSKTLINTLSYCLSRTEILSCKKWWYNFYQLRLGFWHQIHK